MAFWNWGHETTDNNGTTETMAAKKVVVDGQEFSPANKGDWAKYAEACKTLGKYDGMDISTTAAKKTMLQHELILNGTEAGKAQQIADERFGIEGKAAKSQSQGSEAQKAAAKKPYQPFRPRGGAGQDEGRPGRTETRQPEGAGRGR